MMRGALRFLMVAAACAHEARQPPAARGQVIAVTVHSQALAANMLGDPADARVMVYLPPGYDSGSSRYPVLYLLHGYTQDEMIFLDGRFQGFSIEVAAPPFIVVMPRSKNAYDGAFYRNSPVTGRWEDFLIEDLVPWIDARFRTLATSDARGIAGHSMGGFGALRLALRHPDLFGAVYAFSPCCIEDQSVQDVPPGSGTSIHSRADFAKARFFDRVAVAISASCAVEAGPPPLFAEVTARDRWLQHLPAENGRRLRAIAIDFGRQDSLAHIPSTARQLAASLRDAGATVELDEYEGGHSDRVGERVAEHVLPFFRRTLSFAR
jgi:S-formylglutathione hydrolase